MYRPYVDNIIELEMIVEVTSIAIHGEKQCTNGIITLEKDAGMDLM